ncbi:MAG TPA: protein kinase [Ktedonobacteraceae bacterium]|nr:protein kinase [Ktedonobacteraceae bacterium]
MADRTGQQLGNYRLIRLLGRGGFAEVYLGQHVYLNNQAALKVLQIILNDADIEHFAKEARTLASLTHPHIVRVFDFAVENGTPFLVMEYAVSGTLRQRHPLETRLPTETVISYIRQIASALQYAHDQRLVHRDIKPENMLVGSAGEILMSDFGLALPASHSLDQSTQAIGPALVGTTPYMAPEQLQGRPQPASDQYALGVVVYEWLSGKRPFYGTAIEIAMQHISVPAPALRDQVPSISASISEVVMRALAKDPQQRYASVQDFASALERAYQYTLLPRASFALPEGNTALQNILKPGPMWRVPTTFTPLVGRESEVATICELLQRSDVRLVTLVGTGGIGKTRLSYQVAREMQPYFADGVCLVHLATVNEPDLVVPTIALELGIQEAGSQGILEQVKAALSGRHFLLLLDNFEQVVEAAPLIEEVLSACPRLKVVVTSRAVLHVDAEYQFPVPPLGLPDLDQTAENEAYAQYAAIALFIQRAQAVQPAFQLTPDNARTIAEICVRLDGLPLAIELAAARVKLLPPQHLLARLEEPFKILSSASRTFPPRHQTLHNALQWSYDLLDSDEQRIFRNLSVFAGGWTVEAVESMEERRGRLIAPTTDSSALVAPIPHNPLPDPPVLDIIGSLLDKSLLVQRKQEGREPRLQMLLTVREYALELLRASGEIEQTQQAHALYFLSFVEQAESHLKGPQQSTWILKLEREQENMRTALAWLLKQGDAELALRFCGALSWFWYLRGYWSEGRRWLDAALGLTQANHQTAERAKALYGAGNLAYYQDDYAIAHALWEESVQVYRALGMREAYANVLGDLGVLTYVQGDLAAARPLLEESERLCRTSGNTWELAWLLRKLGYVSSRQGDLARAAAYAQEGLALARKLGDKSLIATTLLTSSDIAMSSGNLTQAVALDQEVLALARELGLKSLISIAVQDLGYLAGLQGNLPQALVRAQEGLALARELGDKSLIASTLHTLGYLAALQGDLSHASACYEEGLLVAREIGYERYIGLHLVGLAIIASEAHPGRAARLFGAAGSILNIDVDMNTTERAEYARAVERTRNNLGEMAFKAAWVEGSAMTPEQALSTPEDTPAPPLPPQILSSSFPVYPDGLTAREVEVLRLLAEGMSVAQIAEALIISPRTVSTHITSIYRKIQVSSRSAATRYAIEHKLV